MEAMEAMEPVFKCAICFTDEDKSVVNPEYCKHKICFKCYTNLILRHKNDAKCPECRTPFLKQEDLIPGNNAIRRVSRYIALHAELAISDVQVREELFNGIYRDRTNTIEEKDEELPPLPEDFAFDIYAGIYDTYTPKHK
jgi:hypothetical protein